MHYIRCQMCNLAVTVKFVSASLSLSLNEFPLTRFLVQSPVKSNYFSKREARERERLLHRVTALTNTSYSCLISKYHFYLWSIAFIYLQFTNSIFNSHCISHTPGRWLKLQAWRESSNFFSSFLFLFSSLTHTQCDSCDFWHFILPNEFTLKWILITQ